MYLPLSLAFFYSPWIALRYLSRLPCLMLIFKVAFFFSFFTFGFGCKAFSISIWDSLLNPGSITNDFFKVLAE